MKLKLGRGDVAPSLAPRPRASPRRSGPLAPRPREERVRVRGRIGHRHRHRLYLTLHSRNTSEARAAHAFYCRYVMVTLKTSIAAYPMTIDIESLYRNHGPVVFRRCQYLLGNQVAAMDTMQDVFVELLRRRERLDSRAPMGLVLTIATNLCLNRLRSSRRRSEHPDGEIVFEIANLGNDSNPEDRALARRILDRLFHQQADSTRLIAILYYVDRMTLAEVASEVGMSISGVRKRLAALPIRQSAFESTAPSPVEKTSHGSLSVPYTGPHHVGRYAEGG
jgi:RNA polymerase sigma-70 factor (ECF subfamily)